LSRAQVVSLPTATVDRFNLQAQIDWMLAKHRANQARRSQLMSQAQMEVHVADREDLMELKVIASLKALQQAGASAMPQQKAVAG